jgi:hypothetical protein
VSGNAAQAAATAGGLGGGAYIASGGSLTVDAQSSFAGNRASTSGNDRYPA